MQLLLEPAVGPFVDDEHTLALCLRSLLFLREFTFLDGNAILLGQPTQGIRITQLFVLHDEANRTASLSTSKALAVILGGRHHEGWRAVIVEGAETLEIGSCPLEADEVAYDIYYLRSLQYLVFGNEINQNC